MNKIKHLFLVFAILMLLPTISYADYSCDFENGAPQWFFTPQELTDERGVGITTDPENSNNQVLLLDGTPGRTSASLDFGNMSGIIEISFKVRFEDVGNSVVYYAMIGSKDGEVISPNIHNGYFIYRDNSGKMVYTNGAASDKWINVRYVIDTGAMTYSVYEKGGKYSNVESTVASNYPLDEKAIVGICKFNSRVENAKMYLDDITVTKKSESSSTPSVWMYSTQYKTNHTDKTIGNFRYNTPKSVLLNSIEVLEGVTTSITGEGDYLLGGEELTLTKGESSQKYKINVRTPSMTKLVEKIKEDLEKRYPASFKGAFIIK